MDKPITCTCGQWRWVGDGWERKECPARTRGGVTCDRCGDELLSGARRIPEDGYRPGLGLASIILLVLVAVIIILVWRLTT